MIFYILAILPIIVWGIQWCLNRRVVWQEAAAGTFAALAVAAIFNIIEAAGVFIPSDTETWSGRVLYAQYQPRWKEYYEYAVYRTEIYYTTDSKGNTHMHTRQVFDHWEPTSRWHENKWWTVTELGTYGVSELRYNDVLKEFGGTITKVQGDRRTGEHNSRMIEGTPYDDRTLNTTGYVYPVIEDHKFENRLLKATTLYNFEPVPQDQVGKLFVWPNTHDTFKSNRLLGSASEYWNPREWDQMNAVLGPTKNVNLIAIGFPAGTSLETGILQQRYWNGGKKNDLILTYGGNPNKPEWTYVFGWTEKEACKRLLENRLREGTATIDEITKIVVDEYQLLNFEEKFAHVEVDPPWWYYLIFFIVVAVTQTIAHFVCVVNEYEKFVPTAQQRYPLRFPRRYS